ncbi:hypothetical protein [Paenibacillus kandeliae]|uniref:hypothetical protein n=1 Tax=Paenibacillus kandeliae TaxID=3231269 RepID=UPI00345788CB
MSRIRILLNSVKLWLGHITFEKTLSIIAILISACAIIISLYQYEKSNQELISIFPYQPDGDYTLQLIKGPKNDEYTFSLPAKFLISNNGEKTVSLVYFSSGPYKKINKYPSYSAQTDVGLVDEKQQELRLPFIIPSGEGKIFLITNDFVLSSADVDSLNKIHKQSRPNDIWNESINYYMLLNYALNSGVDLFGSQLQSESAVITDEKGPLSFELDIKKADPFASIFFRSSKGNEFRKDLSFIVSPTS